MRTNAEQILRENFNEVEGCTFREYVEACAESDPNFFRWLFNEEFDNDFDSDLSDEQREEYNDFIETL